MTRRWIAWAATVSLLLAGCEASTTALTTDGGRRHVVVDTDLAFDDILALLYLTQRDDVTIDAVTIAGTGEAHCDPGVANAKALLALGGSPDTPVACGRETPLEGTNAFPDPWREAVDDLSMLELPEVDPTPDPRGAVGLLRDTLGGDATLITLGPLTNVAEALREDPGLAERVPAFVAMAGAVDVAGNAPSGAEFNVWVDALAAQEVLERMDVSLVPLDATNQVPFNPYFVRALEENLETPAAEAVATLIEQNEERFLSGGYSFWDPLATVLAFEEDIATWEEAEVSVSISAGTAGSIDRAEGGSPVRFANHVPDPLSFESEYLTVLTGVPVGATRPEPTLTVAFDGETCTLEPPEVGAGTNDVAFANGSNQEEAFAVVVSFAGDGALGYEGLREALGPDGSRLDQTNPDLQTIQVLAFLGELTPVEIPAGPIAGVCISGRGESPRVWLTDAGAAA